MRRSLSLALLAALLPAAGAAAEQELAVKSQLEMRGAPAEFAQGVADVIAAAERDGLPASPLADKALEGWAKHTHVPPDRILAVLRDLSARLAEARDATVAAGLTTPPGPVVAAAAEALRRGLTGDDVRALVVASSDAPRAAAALTVAASLTAQGLDRAAAIKAVTDAASAGDDPGRVLELPSAVADLLVRGVPMADVARQILEGGGLPIPGRAAGVMPPVSREGAPGERGRSKKPGGSG